ncbi:hypothetical protein [Pseudomonas sp. S2_C03]
MMNLKQKITNPMTVIAIFATLSETSAALSLPFLDHKEREVYIWFLISFPFYLLMLFFATLNFNYRSLYAPSDYEKGEHFIDALDTTERPDTAKGPPDLTLTKSSTSHHIELPARVKGLHIVDARCINGRTQWRELLGRTAKSDSAHVVVFLITAESQSLFKESAVDFFRQVKKRSSLPFCVVYNLSSHTVTLIDQTGTSGAQRPVAF